MTIINRKQMFVGLGISIFALLSSFLGFMNLSDGVSSEAKSRSWMKDIDGNKYLSQISLPGSHDSGALYSIADLAGKCQDLSISKQLQIGARFLDIRLKYTGNNFRIVHSFVDQKVNFEIEFENCINFLKQNPSETIIMSLKKDDDGADGFAESLEIYLKQFSDYIYTARSIPQLKDVRGKIVIFSRYDGNTIGLDASHNWRDPNDGDLENTFEIINNDETYHIQDFYKFKEVETKWSEVKKCFDYTSANIDPKVLSVNFLSGYLLDSFPPSYSVPTAKYVNDQFILYKDSFTKSGIVLFDFIDEKMSKIVYSKNF